MPLNPIIQKYIINIDIPNSQIAEKYLNFTINALSSTQCSVVSQGTKNYSYWEGSLWALMK